MNGIKHLVKQVDTLLAAIETRQEQQRVASTSYGVIIYDPATGLPLPGYEPQSDSIAQFWLPAKNKTA